MMRGVCQLQLAQDRGARSDTLKLTMAVVCANEPGPLYVICFPN